jgi:hypothetical protein
MSATEMVSNLRMIVFRAIPVRKAKRQVQDVIIVE